MSSRLNGLLIHLFTASGAALGLAALFCAVEGRVVATRVALWRSKLLDPAVVACIVCAASALYFSDRRMKTEDLWFRGFPAIWNVLVLISVRVARRADGFTRHRNRRGRGSGACGGVIRREGGAGRGGLLFNDPAAVSRGGDEGRT